MTNVGQTHAEDGVPDVDQGSDDSDTAIAVVIDFVGATLSQVDQLLKAMRLAAGGPGSSGRLFQWSRSTLDGVRVTEVWQSRRAFELIQAKELEEGLIGARMPRPEITVYEVHSYVNEGPGSSDLSEVESGPVA